MYQMKLLQLIGIQEHEKNHYLQIKMKLDQEVNMYWMVDAETAAAIQELTDFSNGYLYRLSFITLHGKASITRNYREQSTRLDFACSESYLQELSLLKQVESTTELDKLSFISRNLVEAEPEMDEPEMIEPEIPTRSTKKRWKPSWPIVTVLITVIAILFSYSGHSLLSNAIAVPSVSGEAATNADIHGFIPKQQPVEMVKPKPENLLPEESISMEKIPAVQTFNIQGDSAYKVPDGMVALTFDDGPSQYSSDIVDILKEFGVGGTFFAIGVNVKNYPDQLKYVADNGYSIGTHTMTHANLAVSTEATQKNEILQSSEAIEAVTGMDVDLFRPPYGNMNDATKQLAKNLGEKIVLWNNDTRDWESRDAEKIINHVKTTDVSGSIILLHETKATVQALPTIIAYLLKQDLEIVTLR